jgi:dTDP-glucose 4,6-dehydratase
MAYHRYHKLDTRIARIFNTYGERMRMDDGRAIPAFMSQALRGEDVTVFGEGSQTRSICFVSDLVEGIYQLMMSNHVLPMNIGNPEEISMEQLAREIIQLAGSKSRIVHKPLPEDDPKVRQPDISAAREVLKWQPKVRREEGLRRTMAYFRKKLGL